MQAIGIPMQTVMAMDRRVLSSVPVFSLNPLFHWVAIAMMPTLLYIPTHRNSAVAMMTTVMALSMPRIPI